MFPIFQKKSEKVLKQPLKLKYSYVYFILKLRAVILNEVRVQGI